jgi:hypothetical protein
MKPMHDWEVRRRDLLKTLGVGMGCLPFLHSHKALAAGTGAAPKKLLIVASTEGYRQMNWRPKDGSLLTQTLPDSSSPLERHKANMIFMPDMTNPAFAGPRHGGFPNHLAAGPNSGVNEYRVPYSATVDQVVGSALIVANPSLSRATLNLGVLSSQGLMGEGNNSRFCIYKGKDQPVPPEQDPWKTYGQIFGGVMATTPGTTTPAAATGQAAVAKLMARKQSILDYVGTDLQKFATRVGTDYQTIIGGHLQAIRDLEKELQALGSTASGTQAQCSTLPGTAVTATDASNYGPLVQAQLNLAVMSLKCGVTQVATMQMVDAGGGHIPFNFVPGVGGMSTVPSAASTGLRTWHDLSHNPVTNGVDMKSIVDKWCITQFATMLDQMVATPEPGGTMLDNSVVLITNHMQDGANHDTQKLPWMLAGSCQGFFKTGQSALSTGNPINGVLTDVCNAMGVPVTYFGDPGFGKSWAGLRA